MITIIIELRDEMSDAKYQILIFPALTIYDYKSIEDNLTAMASKGWRTESVGAFLWKFKRSEPVNKKFSVLFTSSASEFKPVSTERQELLEKLCSKGGWEKEHEWKQMQIFCADQEVMQLETDEVIRLENIHRNMKKTFIPNWTKVLLLMLVLAFSNGMKYFGYFPHSDEKTVWAFLIALHGVFISGFTLLGYLFWLKASRKKIFEGGTCVSTAWYRRFLTVLVIVFITTFIGSCIDTKIQIGEGLIFYIIIYMIAVLAAVSFINFYSQFLKKKGWSSGISTILYSIVTIMLIISVAVIMNVIEAVL